ncbi:unnamed protein product [Prorocentrum cordatum]|uniref:Uncharacterized protein n=1 Tax=Prorocentrum cordatum TaxID=2364126 RepID=A0ABN9XJM0_9DINO|nr:unnamed protein product [Polarella glacialis]|mmetsp:Transcript_71074/g.185288  ORF Transcript_71074/g.185288 Transcript_71074/m.185288 type:complete len:124 (+) Transcript_71074:71-442(+)
MVFGTLFGSRLLPRQLSLSAARLSSGTTVTAMTSSARARGPLHLQAAGFHSGLLGNTLARAGGVAGPLVHPAQPALGAVRGYGTRSLWNVKSGKMWFLVWMVGCTAVGGLMQEVIGPYVFFHE